MIILETTIDDIVLRDEIDFINKVIENHFGGFLGPSIKIEIRVARYDNDRLLGEYRILERMICLNSVQNLKTLYHEVSHAIDYELFKRKKLSKVYLSWMMWGVYNFRLSCLFRILKLNLSPSAKISAYFYYLYFNEKYLKYQERMAGRLGNDDYWSKPEEVFARTMEVWFFNESIRLRGLAMFEPTFYTLFPKYKNEVSLECVGFFNSYLKESIRPF